MLKRPLFIVLAVLAAILGALLIAAATIEIPPPTARIEKVIPLERFAR